MEPISPDRAALERFRQRRGIQDPLDRRASTPTPADAAMERFRQRRGIQAQSPQAPVQQPQGDGQQGQPPSIAPQQPRQRPVPNTLAQEVTDAGFVGPVRQEVIDAELAQREQPQQPRDRVTPEGLAQTPSGLPRHRGQREGANQRGRSVLDGYESRQSPTSPLGRPMPGSMVANMMPGGGQPARVNVADRAQYDFNQFLERLDAYQDDPTKENLLAAQQSYQEAQEAQATLALTNRIQTAEYLSEAAIANRRHERGDTRAAQWGSAGQRLGESLRGIVGMNTDPESVGFIQNFVHQFAQSTLPDMIGSMFEAGAVFAPSAYDDVREQGTYAAAQWLRGLASGLYPTNPELQENFVATQLPMIMGSLAQYIGGAAGVARGATARGATQASARMQAGGFSMGLAGAQGTSEVYERARQAGGDLDQSTAAARWGFIPGAIQAAPIFNFLHRADRATGGQLHSSLMRRLMQRFPSGRDITVAAFEEALLETVGQGGFNLTIQQLIDQDQDLLEGLEEAALIGGGAGAVAQIALSMFGGSGRTRTAPTRTDTGRTPPPPSGGAAPIGEIAPVEQVSRETESAESAESAVVQPAVETAPIETTPEPPARVEPAPVETEADVAGQQEATIAWADARPGDVTEIGRVVARQVTRKRDAQSLADEVGGRVVIDSPRGTRNSWAVVVWEESGAVDLVSVPTAPTDAATAPVSAQPEAAHPYTLDPATDATNALVVTGLNRGAFTEADLPALDRLSRAIARVDGATDPTAIHVGEALQYMGETTVEARLAEVESEIVADAEAGRSTTELEGLAERLRAIQSARDADPATARSPQQIANQEAIQQAEAEVAQAREALEAIDRVYEDTQASEALRLRRTAEERQALAEAEARLQEAREHASRTDAYLEGQPNLFSDAQPQEVAAPESGWGESNRIVTQERAEEIRRKIREEMGRAQSGISPQQLALAAELAVFHVEAGARNLADFTSRMVREFGESIRPHLAKLYADARARVALPEGAPSPSEVVGLKKSEIARMREAYGLEALDKPQRDSTEAVLNRAKSEGLIDRAESIAESVVGNPRAITTEEHAAITYRAAVLADQEAGLVRQASEAADAGNTTLAQQLLNEKDAVLAKIELLTRAADLSGTEAGRILNIRKMMLNREVYTLAETLRRARAEHGRRLSPDTEQELADLTRRLEEAEARVTELEAAEQKLAEENARIRAGRDETLTVRNRKRGAIRSERDQIKAELRKMGLRVNSVFGIDPEALYLIGRLARTYAEELSVTLDGAALLEATAQRVREDVPDLTDADVWNALNASNPKFQQRVENESKKETRKRLREIKAQARILARMDRLLQGMPEERLQRREASDEVQALRKQYNDLKLILLRGEMEQSQLEAIIAKIEEAQQQLETGERTSPKPRKEDSPTIADAKKKLNELRALIRATDTIADLEQQLETGEFKIKPRVTQEMMMRDLPEELQRAKTRVYVLRKQVREAIRAQRPLTWKDYVREILTLPRTIKATMDTSYFLRQGALLSIRRPGKAMKGYGQSLKALFNEESAHRIEMEMRAMPEQEIREAAGLFLGELDGGIRQREEFFANNVARHIPGFGAIVRASDRNMTVGTNLIRIAAFDGFVKSHPDATTAELKAWADYVNAASGRGDLGRFTSASENLAFVFFAPRFAVSRIQAPWKLAKYWQTPRVRNEIAKDLAAFYGTGILALTLAAAAGAAVGLDPRDSDFGKITVGNTRYDIFAGFLQPLRAGLRLGFGATDAAGVTGRDLPDSAKRIDPIDMLTTTFVRYKLSPWITTGSELMTGRTIVGEDVTRAESMLNAMMPILLESTWESYQREGLSTAVAVGVAETIGLGASTYDNPLRDQYVKPLLKRANYLNPGAGNADTEAFRDFFSEMVQENREELREIEDREVLKEILQDWARYARTQVPRRIDDE